MQQQPPDICAGGIGHSKPENGRVSLRNSLSRMERIISLLLYRPFFLVDAVIVTTEEYFFLTAVNIAGLRQQCPWVVGIVSKIGHCSGLSKTIVIAEFVIDVAPISIGTN